jgi:hypothetical protein
MILFKKQLFDLELKCQGPTKAIKLSIVPYAAGPDSRGHSKTAFANIPMSNCFPNFIVRWILNFVDQPSHTWCCCSEGDILISFRVLAISTKYILKFITVDFAWIFVSFLQLKFSRQYFKLKELWVILFIYTLILEYELCSLLKIQQLFLYFNLCPQV